jgi:GntR family transcriptional regulator
MIIDSKSNTPIYQQIVQQIRDAVAVGVYRPGEALPSLRALAVEIRVNPNTIQRAYEELERQGLIESRRGIGVFVIDRQTKAAKSKIERETQRGLQESILAALNSDLTPARIRELFELALDSSVVKARNRP